MRGDIDEEQGASLRTPIQSVALKFSLRRNPRGWWLLQTVDGCQNLARTFLVIKSLGLLSQLYYYYCNS